MSSRSDPGWKSVIVTRVLFGADHEQVIAHAA